MTQRHFRSAAAILAGGAALLVAGCGDRDEAENVLQANEVYGNMSFEEPGNDLSAMEMAGNESEPAAAEPGPVVGPGVDTVAEPGTGGVLGETSGGDTGGNTVESNVSGM